MDQLVFEGIELACTGDACTGQTGVIEVLVHALTSDTQGARDLAHGQAMVGEAVDLEDGTLSNHNALPENRGRASGSSRGRLAPSAGRCGVVWEAAAPGATVKRGPERGGHQRQ